MEEKELRTARATQAKNKIENVSPAVIKRLPRYFRYLRELIREGKLRISSGELMRSLPPRISCASAPVSFLRGCV